MANYALTKKVIDDNIRRNGRRAITGPVLNAVLTQMLSTLGIGGYKLGGVVSPEDTFVPGDADMFFVATQPGTYVDFGGFVLNEGEIGFLSFNGEWHNTAVSAGGSVDAYTKAESDDKFATKGAVQELSGNVGSISTNLASEIQRATGAEIDLSQRIDTIVQGRNVRDIVGNYAELEAYDTSTLGDNDIVMVLLDNTKSDHTTYYRWKQEEGAWEFIGGLAFTYTKTEIDAKFSALHIVLPTIPADAKAHPENYQELLAQVDTMVRGAGADASFKMPIADVGNVDVTFVKTNPANVYLGLFADQASYLYRIIRTTTTPRVYSCEIVFKAYYTDGEVDSIIDETIRDVVRSIPFIGVSATQSQLSEVYEAVVAHPNAVYRFDNGIVVASVKVASQPAPFEPSVILEYHDGEYIRTLTIDKVVDDDVVEYQILRQIGQLASMASLTQLENNVVKLDDNQFIGGKKRFENIEVLFEQLVDEDTGDSLYNALASLEPKHFVAIYGTTTYAEIKAAYEAGQTVLVKLNDALFHITHLQADRALFGGVYSFVLYNITILASTNKWSTSTASISKSITDYVGDKTLLNTADKSSLVGAINEVLGTIITTINTAI